MSPARRGRSRPAATVMTLAALSLTVACQATPDAAATVAATPDAAPAVPASEAPTYTYYELSHEGRIYVTGSPTSYLKFLETRHLPYTLTLIGEGPRGETVVIEIDSDDPGLQEWLEAEFHARSYYAEEQHGGRTYVFGNPATHEAFRQTHHMPYTLTLIGEGPRGETVVIEIDKQRPELQERLRAEFAARYGLPWDDDAAN